MSLPMTTDAKAPDTKAPDTRTLVTETIAQTLRLSLKTVANYQTHIRQTLQVGGALDLLRYGREHGLIER